MSVFTIVGYRPEPIPFMTFPASMKRKDALKLFEEANPGFKMAEVYSGPANEDGEPIEGLPGFFCEGCDKFTIHDSSTGQDEDGNDYCGPCCLLDSAAHE